MTRTHYDDGCACGENDFVRRNYLGDEDDIVCRYCDTAPRVDGKVHRAVHRARKVYGSGHSQVRPGDLYERKVRFGHHPGGPFTLCVTRSRIEKGAAWGEEAGERSKVLKSCKRDPKTYRWDPIYY